ncbi:hypothetical protein KSP40_PGU003678 [Platanthera guangdongensis]|uniref:Ribosomal protein L18e/L15P domain-containing protein n=1 Tax=Platanthera guangdongensis TaxID=2320717 RepID=A0ABR2M3J8_9ASPA
MSLPQNPDILHFFPTSSAQVSKSHFACYPKQSLAGTLQFLPTPMDSCLSTSYSSVSSPFLQLTVPPFKGNLDRLRPSLPSLFFLSRARDKYLYSPTPNPLVHCRCSAVATQESASPVRFRLNSLGPQPGSRKQSKRKGRGIAAGQGNSCGFGMKGKKSRSGPGVRKGFEGGQMSLYRRIPELRGIAGGGPFSLKSFRTFLCKSSDSEHFTLWS